MYEELAAEDPDEVEYLGKLGTLAVLACARCHGTHRIAYDIRQLFVDRQSWVELIKH